jgi:hypothetical protein
MPASPTRSTVRRLGRSPAHRYDPDALDALSQRHAELQRELGAIRAEFGGRSIATALEQFASFEMQLRGFIESHEAVLLRPLAHDWESDHRVFDQILRSRLRWRGIVASFAVIASTLAAVRVEDEHALAAIDFRLAEASHRLGEALREDRASLFLLFLSPNQAPRRTH